LEKEITLENILKGCSKSDIQCQEALYKHCYAEGMKTCLRYADSRNEAASLYNNAMLKVFKSISIYTDEGKFMSWFRTIVINTCIDVARLKTPFKHNQLNEEYTDAMFISPDAADNISVKEILALVRALPENLRIIFNLFAVEGYTHEQISGMLQIRAGTSKWYLSEARKQLKQKLEKDFSPFKSLSNDR